MEIEILNHPIDTVTGRLIAIAINASNPAKIIMVSLIWRLRAVLISTFAEDPRLRASLDRKGDGTEGFWP
jgi:hypothetical protein